MKTIKLILLTLLIPALSAAGTEHKGIHYGPKVNKVIARKVMKRTAVIIMVAHKKVKEGKVHTGDLARSIAHQKFARRLYSKGMFLRAIHHSRIARILAIRAIKANKGVEPPEGKFTAEEEAVMKNSPSEEDLKKELDKEMPGEKTKDEDVINNKPDVDVPDSE